MTAYFDHLFIDGNFYMVWRKDLLSILRSNLDGRSGIFHSGDKL